MASMTHLKHGNVSDEPGIWEEIGNRLYFSCPMCLHILPLENYLIRHDGVVERTVPCEYNCGFSDFLRLEGWSDGG